jgi:glycosyltransferase involved in cell wall biosynthesis
VVNDGSTDNSAGVIEQYAGDGRLKCINQPNAGVSAARNAGVAAATGAYLSFVDSDDYIEKPMYETLYNAIQDNKADVAVCDYNLVYDRHTDFRYSGMRDEVVDLSQDIPYYFYRYCACAKPNNYICTRLYKTQTIKEHGLRFERFKLSDDTLFNFKLLPYIRRAVHISEGLYNYVQRENSSVYTVAKRNNLAEVYADTFEALAGYYQSKGFERFLEVLSIHAYTRLRSVIFYSRLAGVSEGEIARSIQEGFRGRKIIHYLRDISQVDRYVKINGCSGQKAEHIKHVMQMTVEKPWDLTGVLIE